jgi:predicted short-subunit dehydrogenase-like oxidoreductase (DUF2520 family)
LAVPDRAIGEAAGRLVELGAVDARGVVLHCAGALPAREALAPVAGRVAGVGLLHPLRALSGRGAPLAGTVFAVEGDARGRRVAARLARKMGGRPLVLDGARLARYHAAAALAGNHTLALVELAVRELGAVGLPRRRAEAALASLLASAADNVARLGLPAALTGPIARGDAATVERHLAALAPAARAAYLATARPTLDLARDKRAADRAGLARLARLLANAD